ncbi:MAG: NAD-dependent epimerase/dehydratase family protein [Promethearchaeota archaeon]
MNDQESYTLITGGSGQLGSALVELLLQKRKKIRILDKIIFPNDDVESIIGDIRDKEVVKKACISVNTVFHCTAIVEENDVKLQYQVNVEGTRNIINACREMKIPKLIFVSSFDVVLDGRKPLVDGDESLPYPKKYLDRGYSLSKKISEIDIIKANGPNLSTCIIRPAGIYGPYDKYHLPNIIKLAKSKFKLKIGNGKAKFSHVFSGNVAHALILASEQLNPDSPIAGQYYFIGDHEAINYFDFMSPFLNELNLSLPKKGIPFWFIYFIGWACDILKINSKVTRFSVASLCVDRTISYLKATKDFGYKPIFSREEAFEKTLNWLKQIYM